MTVTIVLAISLLLQFLAAYFALRLIKVTGHSLAWGLIAAAITLMAVRRGISLIEILTASPPRNPDLTVELIALAISILMALGIERIGPIFAAIRSTADRLQESEAQIRELNHGLEHRVAERTEQLEAAYREMEAFSYSVSHDLRAPLRALSGYALILKQDRETHLGADGQHCLTEMDRNLRRMEQMIDDILQFSRMSRLELASATIDMEDLAREVAAEVREAAADRAVDFRIGPLPPAVGDRSMVRQVFVNLFSNAVKFSAQRPISTIEVAAMPMDVPGTVAYRVRDNGVGFDMQYANKLFGVFQRLHSASEFEGTGIGLAIAKRVIDRHGGRIWAEGEPNVGASFYFTLPAAPADSAH